MRQHLICNFCTFLPPNLTPSSVAVRLRSTTKQSWPLHHHCFEGLVAVVRLIVSPLIAKSHGPLASSHLNFHIKEFMCIYELYEGIYIYIYRYTNVYHTYTVYTYEGGWVPIWHSNKKKAQCFTRLTKTTRGWWAKWQIDHALFEDVIFFEFLVAVNWSIARLPNVSTFLQDIQKTDTS